MKRTKRKASPQVAARRREAANLTHKGWTQAAIASHLKVPQGTVSRDLAAMREFWREFPVYDFEKVRFEQLQKIDLIEAQAWAAWQRSQGQRHSAALTRGKTGQQTRTSLQDQYGDPRYLREIARCVAQRYEMIGVQPPKAPPETVALEIPECSLTDAFRHYLTLHGMFGDPPYKPRGGLTAEHFAALVEEHKREPLKFLCEIQKEKQRRETLNRENSMGRDGVEEGAPAAQDQPRVPPQGG